MYMDYPEDFYNFSNKYRTGSDPNNIIYINIFINYSN